MALACARASEARATVVRCALTRRTLDAFRTAPRAREVAARLARARTRETRSHAFVERAMGGGATRGAAVRGADVRTRWLGGVRFKR